MSSPRQRDSKAIEDLKLDLLGISWLRKLYITSVRCVSIHISETQSHLCLSLELNLTRCIIYESVV